MVEIIMNQFKLMYNTIGFNMIFYKMIFKEIFFTLNNLVLIKCTSRFHL